jgi:pimeloyl-ACP methyl ester carboxylesterase
VEAGGFESVVAELARLNLPEGRRDDEELVALNERMGGAVGPGGLLRQLAAQQSRESFLADLGTVSVPTLVVGGELDEVCPVALQQELASVVPGARLELLAGVGHLSPLEAPEQLAALLAGWLRTRAYAAAPVPPGG